MNFLDINEEKIKPYLDDPLDTYARTLMVDILFELRLKILGRQDLSYDVARKVYNKIRDISKDILPNDLTLDEINKLREVIKKVYE